jgi:parallel beta-helix repeat protein
MTRLLVIVALLTASHAFATTYYVDNAAKNAADDSPGTEAAPWKTLARAGSAAELKPGDTVLIRSGVYREHLDIKVSGEEGKPITFAAAPGARVVIKASEIVAGSPNRTGKWSKLKDDPNVKEPYPNAFTNVWKITLGDEYFTDPDFKGCYDDKSKRWVSQVILDDARVLQRIGPDPIYRNEGGTQLMTVGQGLTDLVDESFYFDPTDQTLYLRAGGEPIWYNIEIGVRGWTVTASKIHDVIIRGLECRLNRQPGGQWPMASIGECERVVVDNCRFYQADFCGFGLYKCRNCVVRNCDFSYNGNTGFGMSLCEDCTIEDCTLLFNNTRRFHPGWHCGGMKCIPGNTRCTVQRCEAAFNVFSPGIWFDAHNSDIRLLDNVCHHNGTDGIFFEINAWEKPEDRGGLIAGNLVYANYGRGIYDSGSRRVWIVHNTVVGNNGGIICMPREDPFKLDEVEVRNNLLIAN